MVRVTGSNPDFHPADTTYNPLLQRHRGRPGTHRPSPLSAQSTPETVSTLEAPIIDRSNRPRLTIDTGSLPDFTEVSGDLADTPHPSHENASGSSADAPGTYFPPQPPATTDTTDPNPLVSPTRDDGLPVDDSPVSPLTEPNAVGPRVRFADIPHPRQNPPTPLQQHRETLRNLVRDFQTHILEPGEDQPDWTRFEGALQPAAATLAAGQIVHALQHHLPSVQRSQAQMAQLRAALGELQRRQDEDQEELDRLRRENRSFRGALDRLESAGNEGLQVKDLTLEVEQMKVKLRTAEQELQESFTEREIGEGNARQELSEMEEELAALKRAHEAVLEDRQLLRTQAQQAEQNSQRAKDRESQATTTQELSLRQIRDAHSVVQDLREQVSNLQEELQREKKRKTSARAGTAGNKEDGEKSPDSPVPGTNTPAQTRAFIGQLAWPFSAIQRALQSSFSPSSPSSDTAPPSSPLGRARRDLRMNRPRVRSIVDPLAAGGYTTRSIPSNVLHEATDEGLTGVQIVRAIKEHLPDIRDRQKIKGAYNQLQERYEQQGQDLRESEEELARMTHVANAHRRQVQVWSAKVVAMKKAEGEKKKKKKEEEGDDKVESNESQESEPVPVPGPGPGPGPIDAELAAALHHQNTALHHLTTAQSELHNERAQRPSTTTTTTTTQDPNNTSDQTLADLTQQINTLTQNLQDCHAHGAALLAQSTTQTAKLHDTEKDARHLARELADCIRALDAAGEEIKLLHADARRAKARSAERIAALMTRLVEKEKELEPLRRRLNNNTSTIITMTTNPTVNVPVTVTNRNRNRNRNPQWPREGTERRSDGVDVFFFWLFFGLFLWLCWSFSLEVFAVLAIASLVIWLLCWVYGGGGRMRVVEVEG